MRFPSLAFAAVAGLWQQQPLFSEENVISTRHSHVPLTVTNSASTVYEVRTESSTILMDHAPAAIKTRSARLQAIQTAYLELRSATNTTSTMHVKPTQTAEQVASTVFASRVGTSVLTVTNVPQSLIDIAAEEAAAKSSSQMDAVPSTLVDVSTHSAVSVSASTSTPAIQGSSTLAVHAVLPLFGSARPSSSSGSASPSATSLVSTSSKTAFLVGLELRSNTDTTNIGQQEPKPTEATATVVVVIYDSSTSSMTSVPSSAEIVSSESQSSASSTLSDISQNIDGAQTETSQSVLIAVSTNTAGSTVSSTASATSTAVLSPSEIISSSSETVTRISFDPVSTLSKNVIIIPVTASASSTISSTPSSVETSDATPSLAANQATSSSTSSADVAADNAAGASGESSGSFKLSKEGFAAIISIVSVGVSLGILFSILFVIAKRRQWHVRKSISRASRRLTARFSSHPKNFALVQADEKQEDPTLPIIEPRVPNGPRPQQAQRHHQAYPNIDTMMHSNYRGVQSVKVTADTGPQAWRCQMAKERMLKQMPTRQQQQQRKKPDLRINTDLGPAYARDVEVGNVQKQRKSRGEWKDLFRGL